MGKKSAPLMKDALANLLASMEQATHTIVDGDTVTTEAQASILPVPPANADGHQSDWDAVTPPIVVPHGLKVSLSSLGDHSVPPLNRPPRPEGEPIRVRVQKSPPRVRRTERPDCSSERPHKKQRASLGSWFDSTAFDPESGKTRDQTSFSLPLYTPLSVSQGFGEFSSQVLTMGMREENELARGAALMAHAANAMFLSACKEREHLKKAEKYSLLCRAMEKEKEVHARTAEDAAFLEEMSEGLIFETLGLEEKLKLQEKKVAELELAVQDAETLRQENAALKGVVEEMEAKVTEQAEALESARCEAVAEFCASADFQKEQRLLKKTAYEKGALRNIACLRHLKLLDFPKYLKLMSDAEIVAKLPQDSFEATFAEPESEEEDGDEGEDEGTSAAK